MRLFFVLFSAAVSLVIFPSSLTNAQAVAVFEDADASVETSVLAASISPVESAFASFGNGIGVQSLLTQPTISPQENDNVSWGNADATLQATTAPPIFPPAVNFEELLAEKFKPILYFHEEERFRPQEIQVVLDTAVLYKDDTFIIGAPPPLTPELLAGSTDSDFKLDLFGDIFLENSPVANEPYKNTTYVHVTEDETQIVLQYWFFYYFNDWQGAPLGADFTHEGDWEFVQLIFPQDKTVQEIIKQNLEPEEATYSAHAGGYRKAWTAIQKEDNRPVVYIAQGSHANHVQKGFCDLVPQIGVGTDEAHSNINKKLMITDLATVVN